MNRRTLFVIGGIVLITAGLVLGLVLGLRPKDSNPPPQPTTDLRSSESPSQDQQPSSDDTVHQDHDIKNCSQPESRSKSHSKCCQRILSKISESANSRPKCDEDEGSRSTTSRKTSNDPEPKSAASAASTTSRKTSNDPESKSAAGTAPQISNGAASGSSVQEKKDAVEEAGSASSAVESDADDKASDASQEGVKAGEESTAQEGLQGGDESTSDAVEGVQNASDADAAKSKSTISVEEQLIEYQKAQKHREMAAKAEAASKQQQDQQTNGSRPPNRQAPAPKPASTTRPSAMPPKPQPAMPPRRQHAKKLCAHCTRQGRPACFSCL